MDWDIVAVVAAGLSVFLAVLAVLWPRKVRIRYTGTMLPGHDEQAEKVSELIGALNRRGKHLRSTWPPPPIE